MIDVLKDIGEEAEKINGELNRFFLNYLTRGGFNGLLGDIKWSLDDDACFKSVSLLIEDLLGRGGKRWRPYLMKLVYDALGGKEDIGKFLVIPELIHNGTLVVDDIEDNSDMRRGKPALHKIYGNDFAINVGNALYYIPLIVLLKDKELSETVKIKLYEAVNSEMIRISFGQGMDIFWHSHDKFPIENEYLQMCAFKTGTLARLSVRLACILAGASEELTGAFERFAESVGVAFQIQDDILNLSGDLGKNFGDDISEGKKTLLVIRALSQADVMEANDLRGILKMNTKNSVIINEALKIIKKYDSFGYARNVAISLVHDAWDDLKIFLSDSESKTKLELFSNFVVERHL